MAEARGEIDLPAKPIETERRRNLGTKDFQGDVALMLYIAPEKDRRHSAVSDLSAQHVLLEESGIELLELSVRHGREIGIPSGQR